MNRKISLALIALLLASAATLARAGEKKAAAPSEKKTEAAAAAPQGPSPELDKLNVLLATWKCNGASPAGGMGEGSPATQYESTWKLQKELNGFFISGHYEQKKSKTNPHPLEVKGFLHYDHASNAYMIDGFDNGGGVQLNEKATFDGTLFTGNGIAEMGGRKFSYRETMTLKGDSLVWKYEMDMGKGYSIMAEDSCKKAK